MLKLFFKNGITVNVKPWMFDSVEKHKTLNDECCKTCKFQTHGDCNILNYTDTNLDFVCDHYIRKRSGAYRRKRAKENKNNVNII